MRTLFFMIAITMLSSPSYGFKIGGSVGKVIGKVTNPIRDHVTAPLANGVQNGIEHLNRRVNGHPRRSRPRNAPVSSRFVDAKYNNPNFCSAYRLTRQECIDENKYAVDEEIISGHDYNYLVGHNRVALWTSRGDIKGWCACSN